MSQITYKLKNKKVTDKKTAIIESAGHTTEFTIADIEANLERGAKMLTEMEANAELQKSVMDNIEEHHKFVLKMSDQDLHTCAMYFESKKNYSAYSDKAAEIKKYIKKEKSDLKDILAAIPELNDK